LGGLHLFKKDRIISVLDRLIAIITVGALLVVPALTDLLSIKMFVFSQTVAYFITLLVGVQFLFGTKIKLKFRFSMPFAVSIIKQSLPYALLILMMFVYTRTDAVMIERIHPNGQYETGVYAKGFRILDALNMISYLFAVLLLPMFSRMIKNNEDLSPLANTAIRLLLFPMVSAVAIGVIFKEYWMVLLYWNTDQYQTFIFALTLLNAIPMAMVYIFGTLLTAGGKLKWLNIVAVLGVLLNISLNLYLIPTHGALGATYATILTQFVTAAVQVIMAIVIFKVKIPSTLQFQSAVFFGLLLFGIIIHYYLKLSDFMGITFLSLWSIALFFLSGIFKISEVRNILESRR
jgi:O-antigen/teichoic acid export membrane protein